jgi:hypothetical protein
MNQADKIIADCQQKSNEYLAPEFKNFYHIGQLQHHIIELCQEIDILKDQLRDVTTTLESIEL